MSSIADMITQRLQGPQLQQLAGQIGADEQTTQRAVQTAVPMLLGGMARNTAQPEGQAALGRALQNHDGSRLDDIGGLLSGGGGAGAGILGHIFGGRRDTVAEGVGKASGLSGGQAAKLLMILAPIVMAALARRQQGQPDAGGGLGDVLQRESTEAAQRAPGGLGGLMGMLDRDGDGNPLNDLGKLGGGLGGLFGGR
jgi:hypothetical protein